MRHALHARAHPGTLIRVRRLARSCPTCHPAERDGGWAVVVLAEEGGTTLCQDRTACPPSDHSEAGGSAGRSRLAEEPGGRRAYARIYQ